MPASILTAFIEANLAAAGAVALVLFLRSPARQRLGAHAAYALWALVPVALLATLIPARIAAPVILQPAAGSATFELSAPLQQAAAQPTLTLTELLPWLWAAGALALFAWMAIGQFRFQRAMKSGTAGPAILGVLRPRIVIPSNFATHYTQPERDLILAHETAHLARHDSRINALAALLRCAFWFNPFIHIGAHTMRIDQELSCDAAVIARRPTERLAYAQALLKTQLAASPLPLGCYWPARTPHPLTERIAMLNLPPPSQRRRLAAAALITTFAAATGLTAWAFQPQQPAPLIERPTASGLLTRPDYPPESVALKEEGDTALKMCIKPDGSAENIELAESSGHQRLDDAAIAHISNVEFEPATENGAPTRFCDYYLVWRWSLEDESALDSSSSAPDPQQSSLTLPRQTAVRTRVGFEEPPEITSPLTTKPEFLRLTIPDPSRAIQRDEVERKTTLTMCVSPDGTTDNVEILKSSGRPDLDQAHLARFNAAIYQPATQADEPVRYCGLEQRIGWNRKPTPEELDATFFRTWGRIPDRLDPWVDPVRGNSGEEYDSNDIVKINGRVSRIELGEDFYRAYLQDRATGQDWVVTYNNWGGSTNHDEIMSRVGKNAWIIGQRSLDTSCDPACRAAPAYRTRWGDPA